MEPDDLTEWTPFSLRWERSGPVVDWRRLGGRRFVEAFFDQSIHKHQQEIPGANRTTPAGALLARVAALPERPPTGFIFHASRCGSTLVAQMLTSLPRNIVLSEPAILDSVLHPVFYSKTCGGSVTDAEQAQLLRAVVRALGHPRHPEEQHCFVKFSSRAIAKMPLIQHAFPDVPWTFLYRDPQEIIGAYLRFGFASDRLPPGVADAGLIEGDPAELAEMRPEEFWARVLAARFSDALRCCQPGKTLLMNYTQLPEAVCGPMLKLFAVTCSPEEIECMRRAATFNAKAPSREFRNDSDRKRGAVPENVRTLVDSLVMPHYRKLESIRTGESSREEETARNKPTRALHS
jgi:hypothetical protein